MYERFKSHFRTQAQAEVEVEAEADAKVEAEAEAKVVAQAPAPAPSASTAKRGASRMSVFTGGPGSPPIGHDAIFTEIDECVRDWTLKYTQALAQVVYVR
jgi:hypothetical protein